VTYTSRQPVRAFRFLYQGCASSTVLFGAFPGGLFYGYLILLIPAAIFATWLLNLWDVSWSPASPPLGRGACLTAGAVEYLICLTLIVLTSKGGSRARTLIRRASALYLGAVALAVTLFAIPVCEALATRSDTVSGRVIVEGGPGPGPLLVLGVVIALLAIPLLHHNRRGWLTVTLAALLVAGLAWTILWSLADRPLAVLPLAFAIGAPLAALGIVLPYHLRSPSHARSMADALAAFMGLYVALFFYASRPAIYLASGAVFLTVFAIVLLLDNWMGPRQYYRFQVKRG
jgi:hypothetical protein